jgi:hypothetical protein
MMNSKALFGRVFSMSVVSRDMPGDLSLFTLVMAFLITILLEVVPKESIIGRYLISSIIVSSHHKLHIG